MKSTLIFTCLAVLLEGKLVRTHISGTNDTVNPDVPTGSISNLRPDTVLVDSSKPECGKAIGGKACKGSPNGPCCSSFGFCGSTPSHCHSQAKCQTGCRDERLIYSVTEECGPRNKGLPCPSNGPFGSCCSADGFCGNSAEHCKSHKPTPRP